MTVPYRVTWGVGIPMRDGTGLSATVYRPARDTGPLPVIVTVTPYVADSCHRAGAWFAGHGYAFAAVDCRGRGGSGGVFEPYHGDGPDGFDVVEWLAAQDWCDGRVATWGGSYCGFNQWMTVREAPPHLRTAVPVASFAMGIDVPFTGGIALPYEQQWHAYTSGRAVNGQLFGDADLWREGRLDAMRRGEAFVDLDVVGGEATARFRRNARHPAHDPLWATLRLTAEDYARSSIPVLSITGHYEGDQAGTLHYYRERMRHGSPEAVASHFLVIGPWDHAGCGRPAREVGGLRFGEASIVDLEGLHLAWYDMVLRDAPKPAFLADRVVYYLAGAEAWRSAPTLEAVTAGTLPLYLGSDGTAGDVVHSGRLTSEPATGAPSDTYTYDPLDLRPAELEADPLPDYITNPRLVTNLYGNGLVYHSEPFAEPTELAGFVRLLAWISIDTPDTDLEVDLYEITRDGGSIWLTRDMLRARYRASATEEVLVEPGAVNRYEFASFFFFARRIAAGSRLRLVIRCPNSPRFEKNYNGGGVVARETFADARTCHVTVHHDPEHPAVLLLPLAGRAPLDPTHLNGDRTGAHPVAPAIGNAWSAPGPARHRRAGHTRGDTP